MMAFLLPGSLGASRTECPDSALTLGIRDFLEETLMNAILRNVLVLAGLAYRHASGRTGDLLRT